MLLGPLFVAATALLATGPQASGQVTTLKPAYEVVREQNVVVPMPDGTRLVADVYRPVPRDGQPAGQRFPCLFEMTPYRKELRAEEAAGFFPARGFVYMALDARGTGGSEGQYDGVFLRQEQLDGYHAIEWLATRYRACNGKVGMWGGSYSGINQYLIATGPKGTPPHLRALAPQRALTDLYRDIVYTGGILTGSFGAIWSTGTTAYNAIGADPTTAPDPELAAGAFVDHLGNDPMLPVYLNRPFDGPFYRSSSVIDRLRKLDLPTFHFVGLYDAFTRGQLQGVGRLLELEREGKVAGPNYAVVGPWDHTGTHFLAQPPYDRWILDWYRRWLDGRSEPEWFSGPRVTYCSMAEARNGPCSWRRVDRWPPPRTEYRRLYLREGAALVRERPGREALEADRAIASWAYNPLAGQGENAFSKWDNAAGVPVREADQSVEDEWKGITFTTAPLPRPLTIAGPITLSLRASTKPLAGADPTPDLGPLAEALELPGLTQLTPPYHDTDFVAKLADVAPDGSSTLIQSGFLRASHLRLDPDRTVRAEGEVVEPFPFHRQRHLSPPKPGAVRTYKIEIWPTAKRFPAGHRLRIALYSADTANHLTLLKPALNTVHAGSYLLLPERGARGSR